MIIWLVAILLQTELAVSNYMIIKDFSDGRRVLYLDIIKISHDHCMGPIFNLKTQSLCYEEHKLELTEISAKHKQIYEFLSVNQTKSEQSKPCYMVIARFTSCPIKRQMRNARTMNFGTIIFITTNLSLSQEITEFAEREPSSTVSVVMITLKDGLKLLNVTKSKFCYAQLFSYDLPPVTLIIYVFVLGVAVFVTYSIYRLLRSLSVIWMRIKHSVNMKLFMSKMKIQRYQDGNEDSCAICLMEFSQNSKLRKLPCGHGFHSKCIDHWIQSHRPTCPLCNQILPIPFGMPHVKCAVCSTSVTGNHNNSATFFDDRFSQNTVLTVDLENINQGSNRTRLADDISYEMESSDPRSHNPMEQNEIRIDGFLTCDFNTRSDGIVEYPKSVAVSNVTTNDETV